MPDYRTHDRIAWFAAPPVAVATGAILVATGDMLSSAVTGATLLTATHLVCSHWLSPDLDTNSAIHKRWGILAFVWMPYNKVVPHRSWVSHSGGSSLLRIMYLGLIMSLLLWFINLVLPGTFVWATTASIWLWDNALAHPKQALLIAAGACIADMLHVIADWLSTGSKQTLRKILPRWLYRKVVR